MLDRDSGDSYFWSLNNPEDLEQRLQAASVTFAQVLSPSLQQVWHFVYKYFQLLRSAIPVAWSGWHEGAPAG